MAAARLVIALVSVISKQMTYRRNAGGGELLLEELQEGIVADRGAGKVDGAASDWFGGGIGLPFGQHPEGRPDDPAVNEPHQPEPFRGGKEVAGRHEGSRLVAEPDQQLDMETFFPSTCERNDILCKEAEAVFFQSLMDALHPVHLACMPHEVLIFLAVDVDTVAALLLGHETRHVGGPHQLIRLDVLSFDMDQPDAGRNPERTPIPNKSELLYDGPQRFGQVDGAGHGASGQEDAELIAAQPGQEIAVSEFSLKRGANEAQQFVTRGMTAGVVDNLELVEIEEHQGELRPLSICSLGIEPVLEGSAIGNSRQRVVGGLPGQRALY